MDVRQLLTERTAELIEGYYDNDLSLFWKYMRDDVIWVGPAEWHLIEGKAAVRAMYDRDEEHGLRFSIEDLEAHSRQVGREVVTVILKYSVQTYYPDGTILQHKQWLTMLWVRNPPKKVSEGALDWQYQIIHTVNADVGAEQDVNRIYPVHLGKVMQERMAHMIQLRTGRVEKVALEDISRVTYYVPRYDILWVEGKRTHSVVCCQERQIEINCSLERATALLGDDFYRVHRGYLVNLRRIDHMERSVVVLDTGERIPVPPPNFAATKAYIKNWMAGNAADDESGKQ